MEQFELAEGLTIRQTFAHVMSPYLIAFAKPDAASKPHPGPWRPASGGIGFDVCIEVALAEIAGLLDELSLRYAVIGGLANAVWGEPRSTLDVVVTVSVEEPRLRQTIAILAGRFQALPADPVAFVRETSVLPVRSPTGVRIDVIFARLPFEETIIDRAVVMNMGDVRVPVCTA